MYSPHSVKEQTSNRKTKKRDFQTFIAELSDINYDCIVQNNTDQSFSTFYNKLNKF